MSIVKIDFGQKTGRIKPMNCVNNGPSGSRVRKSSGNFEYYKALEIPYARTHDSSFYYANYGGEFTVDVHRIFPNFDADENDASSYIFSPTDEYLQDIISVGTQPFYRLGASIEHGYKKGTIPPKDFHKWARICEHIIRHFTEGWANGFNMKIEYWEIWNEYDCKNGDGSNPCWQGTDEQFYDFYEITAKHLKSCFPLLKIGGPAITSAWSVGDAFLAEMQKRKVPMDFYSFHSYGATIERFVEMVAYAENQIKKFGYENAEIHLNEWNYVRSWVGEEYKYSMRTVKNMKGAAFVASLMCAMQKTALDMLMYYEGRPCSWCGLFDTDWLTPLKPYYSFLAFKEVKKLGESVLSESEEDVYSLASFDGGKGAVMISRYSDDEVEEKEVSVKMLNASINSTIEIYLLDERHDLEKVESVKLVDDTLKLKMPNHTVYLIKISD